MMLGLGVGGVAVGMFHLITHAFFKALLVSRRRLGDPRLHRGAGHPLPGRSAPLHAHHLCHLRGWNAGAVRLSAALLRLLEQGRNPARRPQLERLPGSVLPRIFGALLTAFYMTRQVCYVFFGKRREPEVRRIASRSRRSLHPPRTARESARDDGSADHSGLLRRRPRIHQYAGVALVYSFLFLLRRPERRPFSKHNVGSLLEPSPRLRPLRRSRLAAADAALVAHRPGRTRPRLVVLRPQADKPRRRPRCIGTAYAGESFMRSSIGSTSTSFTIGRSFRSPAGCADLSAWLDRRLWNGAVQAVRLLVTGLGRVDASLDKHAVNAGFDEGCRESLEADSSFPAFRTGECRTISA